MLPTWCFLMHWFMVYCHRKIVGLGYVIIFWLVAKMINEKTLLCMVGTYCSSSDVNLVAYYKRMSIKYCTKQNGAVFPLHELRDFPGSMNVYSNGPWQRSLTVAVPQVGHHLKVFFFSCAPNSGCLSWTVVYRLHIATMRVRPAQSNTPQGTVVQYMAYIGLTV